MYSRCSFRVLKFITWRIFNNGDTLLTSSLCHTYTIIFVLRFFCLRIFFRNFVFQTLGKTTGTAIAMVVLLYIVMRRTLTIVLGHIGIFIRFVDFFCYILFFSETVFDMCTYNGHHILGDSDVKKIENNNTYEQYNIIYKWSRVSLMWLL